MKWNGEHLHLRAFLLVWMPMRKSVWALFDSFFIARKLQLFLLFFLFYNCTWAQDTTQSKFNFAADFRLRAEQDWNGSKSDGSAYEDRLRFRYRIRTGATYKQKNSEFGTRIRTGFAKKQQDPQLTFGDPLNLHGPLPISLEKLYWKYNFKKSHFWFGKNTLSFEQNNELFWSENIFPSGFFFSKEFSVGSSAINEMALSIGNFGMMHTVNAKTISFIHAIQLNSISQTKAFRIFPSFFYMRNLPVIPDATESALMDYQIFQLGSAFRISKTFPLSIEFDYFRNLRNYENDELIHELFKNQKTAWMLGLEFGRLKRKGDIFSSLCLTHIEKYAVVDYLAQNDWARWDYSAFSSPDGRLSNLRGIEWVLARKMSSNLNLVFKYYRVKAIKTRGIHRESGDRVRLDLDFKF